MKLMVYKMNMQFGTGSKKVWKGIKTIKIVSVPSKKPAPHAQLLSIYFCLSLSLFNFT